MYKRWWFGFAEVDIEVPRDLWEEFKEFPPIFINQSVGAEGIPQHMKDYLSKSGRAAMPDQKKLLEVLKAQKVLLYATLLKWYHEHGLEITAVHRTIDYFRQKIFNWFVHEVAKMRRKGDVEAEKALLAEIYRLLGNSAYRKVIEASDKSDVHERRRCCRQTSTFGLFRRSRRDRRRVQDRITQKRCQDKATFPGRHRGISAGQVENVAVLLRLLGQLHRQARLRAYPDGYG